MVMEYSFCIPYEDSLAFCTHTLKGYIFKDYLHSWISLENVHVFPHFLTCTLFSIDPLFVLIEYVPFGDLLGYLRKSRGLNDTYYKDPDIKPQTNLTAEQLMKFAWQVADGMCYLSSKKVCVNMCVRLAPKTVVSLAAVLCLVTQRSSPQTAAHIRTTFLSHCFCGLMKGPIMYQQIE